MPLHIAKLPAYRYSARAAGGSKAKGAIIKPRSAAGRNGYGVLICSVSRITSCNVTYGCIRIAGRGLEVLCAWSGDLDIDLNGVGIAGPL